jgi:cellulose biosynthesis protein BcsQ
MSFIVTFYSYKGGVGRSMALANVAYELARKGKRVLMVDWDLEAPGLERYFDSNKLFKREVAGKGLLQLLMTLSEGPNEKYHDYMSSITARGITSIGLIASGRENDPHGFTTLLEKFNWKHFFSINNGGLHLENLRNQWLKDFDFVLIDSRTGLSDSSGICTIMMPDILVPMFTANYQSLFGVRDIVNFVQKSTTELKV